MKRASVFQVGLLALLLVALVSTAAAAEPATFEAFYRKPFIPTWWLVALAAVVAAGAIIFTGGAASPVVAWIGTSIGQAMGLSGVAATNAGLALLGGGALASGGGGMIAGTVLLTAALTFSGEIVTDYAIHLADRAYSESEFQKASAAMTNLSLPINHSGSKASKSAMAEVKKIAESVERKGGLIDQETRDSLGPLVEELQRQSSTSDRESKKFVGDQTLIALLAFLRNDYPVAKSAAFKAYESARAIQKEATLPAFIYATALLSEPVPNLETSRTYLAYSLTSHKDDFRLRPLLLSIYLDRLVHRIINEDLPLDLVDQVNSIATQFKYEDEKAAVYGVLSARYFTLLWHEQQTVLQITRAESPVLSNNPKALEAAKHALARYTAFLETTQSMLDAARDRVNKSIDRRKMRPPKWEVNWYRMIATHTDLLGQYRVGASDLKEAVKEMEARLKPKAVAPMTDPNPQNKDTVQDSVPR